MSRKRSHGRAQRWVAIILLLCLVVSGLAYFAAATVTPSTTQQTQQR